MHSTMNLILESIYLHDAYTEERLKSCKEYCLERPEILQYLPPVGGRSSRSSLRISGRSSLPRSRSRRLLPSVARVCCRHRLRLLIRNIAWAVLGEMARLVALPANDGTSSLWLCTIAAAMALLATVEASAISEGKSRVTHIGAIRLGMTGFTTDDQ